MASDVRIVNRALGKLGITRYIEALDEDSTEAQSAFQVYEDLRDVCLAAFPWPFATLRKTLARIDTNEEPTRDGFLYVFAMPDDCLRELSIIPLGTASSFYPRNPRSDQKIVYAVEKSSVSDRRVVLCDLATPVLFYTAKVGDPESFDPLFTEALVLKLAAELAMPLTAKSDLEDKYSKQYRLKISEAEAAALSGPQEDQQPETDLVTVRY